MLFGQNNIMEYIEEMDVKFVRLAFCDIFGQMKNISVMASELPRVLREGVPFDASQIAGFMAVEESDLILMPNVSTGEILPWRPQEGRVLRLFCDIRYPDGRPFEGDGRYLLKQAVKKLRELGYECEIGVECEFYLFEMDDDGRRPVRVPHDEGGYLDVTPLDRGENIRREICLMLEEMGMLPQSSHHEKGPGQHEIIFKHSRAASAADHFISFKNMIKTVANINGLHASFMPKPIAKKSGSGLHINFSLCGTDEKPAEEEVCQQFMAGIMGHIKEMTAFLNPTTNSYARFGEFEAPSFITWSRQNRAQLLRMVKDTEGRGRIELRSPDSACNPYFAYALLLWAGMEGIEKKMTLEPAVDITDKTDIQGIEALPASLEEAVAEAEKSSFLKKVLPAPILAAYFAEKMRECVSYAAAEDKAAYDYRQYFEAL